MDNTLQEILTLLEKGTVEQRCAALLVLGALKADSAAVVKVVGTLLEHQNPVLKDYALRFFEEVQPRQNVAALLKRLDDADKEIQERAVRSLSARRPVGCSAVGTSIAERFSPVAIQCRAGTLSSPRQNGCQSVVAAVYRRHR